MAIHRNVLKQKHKPFKNSKNTKAKTKPSILPQKVSVNLDRRFKKSQIIAKKKSLRLNLQEEPPRNVFVVSFHFNINPIEVIKSLLNFYCSNSVPKCSFSNNEWFLSHPILLNSNITHDGIPRRLVFYTCPRNLSDILYSASCSDILLCLFRGSTQNEPAYDEYGFVSNSLIGFRYKILSSLRLQGIPTPVGVDVELGLEGDRQSSSLLVRRYFQSEFGLDKKFTTVFNENDFKNVFSLLGCVSISQLSWRKERGYMLCLNQNYDPNSKELIVEGYSKGLGFSVKNAVHLTSVGDYILKRIELLTDICPTSTNSFKMTVEREVEQQNEENLKQLLSEVVSLNEVEVKGEDLKEEDTNEVLESFSNRFSINKILLDKSLDVKDLEMDEEDNNHYEYEDQEEYEIISSEGSEDLDLLDDYETLSNKGKKIEFEKRSLEELSFPDEADTPVDQPAKERFRKYRSMKNIRSSLWDPYESLPMEYFKINEFENFRATMKFSKTQLKKNCESTKVSGLYIRLTLMNVSQEDYTKLLRQGTYRPLIVSTVLPYERKVSVLNFSVNRTAEGPDILPSKTPLSLFCGFRRFPGLPIYSKTINVQKGKRSLYDRFFKKGDNCIATVYGFSLAPPTPVLALDENETVLFGGHVLDSEPCRIIIKRILLTGYPMKVHKRRAIVRYMFFDPSDIKYFKPVQLFTKRGLRGRILQSLGTHGHMKCLFSDFITQDDIVCLPLYKRVYPKWHPPTWTQQL